MRLTSCPHCDKKFYVPKDWDGQCPQCGKPTGKEKAKAIERVKQ